MLPPMATVPLQQFTPQSGRLHVCALGFTIQLPSANTTMSGPQ